jgi:hypothetical protein
MKMKKRMIDHVPVERNVVAFDDYLIYREGCSKEDLISMLQTKDIELLREINKAIKKYKERFNEWCNRNRLTPLYY